MSFPAAVFVTSHFDRQVVKKTHMPPSPSSLSLSLSPPCSPHIHISEQNRKHAVMKDGEERPTNETFISLSCVKQRPEHEEEEHGGFQSFLWPDFKTDDLTLPLSNRFVCRWCPCTVWTGNERGPGPAADNVQQNAMGALTVFSSRSLDCEPRLPVGVNSSAETGSL